MSVSILDLLATNGPAPKGLLVVLLKSYFDGGNQANSLEYDVLSLAVAMAPANFWPPFERQWRAVLRKHRAVYLHTTDCIKRQGIYKGWTETQRDKFLKDCVKVISQHFARWITDDSPGRFGIVCFVASINLKDFVAYYQSNSDALTNANEGCFRQSINQVILWSENEARCDTIHCFFDQGEPFYGYLVNLLQSKKAMQDSFLLKKIKHRTESDSRDVPGLQMADLFAWAQSHKHDPWNPKWKTKLLSLHFQWEWIDQTNLHKVAHAHQQAWQSWGIPKRGKTQ